MVQGWHRISPANIGGASYSWSWTTPFGLTPGSYSLSVRATDDLGLTTSSTNQGASPSTPRSGRRVPRRAARLHRHRRERRGTACRPGRHGQRRQGRPERPGRPRGPGHRPLRAAERDLGGRLRHLDANLASPGATSTTWTLGVDLPTKGEFAVTAFAVDTAGQQDTSTAGATARYLVYPGDLDPRLSDALFSPTEGTAFTEARIEVAVVNAAGQYMSAAGTFTGTGQSWRSAFLISPGTPGSNFSYTTPVLPSGPYTVRVRAVDAYGQVQAVPREVHVTVSAPAGNAAPVAGFTVACAENDCAFDGRGSSDENAPTLTYAWSFGNGRTGSGPVPSHTYTAAGAFTVILTVRDEYGLTGTVTRTMTIAEPAGNVPPAPVVNPPACTGLVCNWSAVGSADPDPGDAVTYRWDCGDGTAPDTASAVSHRFPAAGAYTVTLVVTDGWGKAASATRQVTVAAT